MHPLQDRYEQTLLATQTRALEVLGELLEQADQPVERRRIATVILRARRWRTHDDDRSHPTYPNREKGRKGTDRSAGHADQADHAPKPEQPTLPNPAHSVIGSMVNALIQYAGGRQALPVGHHGPSP